MSKEWLNTSEAAQALGASEATVRRWSDSGILPVQRVGGRRVRRFKVEHVERLKQRESTPPPRSAGPPPPFQVVLGGVTFEPYSHMALFYDSDAGRLRRAAPFLEEGLRLGQPCYLMAHSAALDGYLERLQMASGVDLERARETGALTIANAPGTTLEGAIQFWEQAFWRDLESHASVLRLVGEMACVRDMFTSEAEMLAFEQALNGISHRFPCIALCQYDVRQFSGESLFTTFRAHPDVLGYPLRNLIN